jgi:hypothetical protein
MFDHDHYTATFNEVQRSLESIDADMRGLSQPPSQGSIDGLRPEDARMGERTVARKPVEDKDNSVVIAKIADREPDLRLAAQRSKLPDSSTSQPTSRAGHQRLRAAPHRDWRAEDEDLETLRPGLVASLRTGRDAHRIPFLELDDLVVDLHPPAPAHDHVHLFLRLVRVAT